jgi:hypothetical protein
MTRGEFYKKYGDVKLKFISYYKYSFTFGGRASDNKFVLVTVGGSSDDIYRLEVDVDTSYNMLELYPNTGEAYYTDRNEQASEYFDESY